MMRAAGVISLIALIAALSYGHEAHAHEPCPSRQPQQTSTCGLEQKFPSEGWLIMHGQRTAIMSNSTLTAFPST